MVTPRLLVALTLALSLPLTAAVAYPLSDHHSRDEPAEDYAGESTFHPASQEAKVYQVGTDIPGVPFKMQPSWAGLIPIEKNADLSIERLKNLPKEQPDALFFWMWGAEHGGSTNDVVIWLNGGPGCSSMVGNLQEVGPIDASDLDAGIKLRHDRWSKDVNLLIVDQPIGTGFSSGDPKIQNEDDLAAQFYGFYTNLVRVFPEIGQMKLSIVAESYGGYFGPFIASYFLGQEETFNLQGLITIDGIIAPEVVQTSLVYYDFVKKNQKLLNVTDQDLDGLKDVSQELGYLGYADKYLKYPPDGPLPSVVNDLYIAGAFDYFYVACENGNPNFDQYDVRDRSDGATSISDFLIRPEVQDYIHAPHIDFAVCSYRDVFPDGDNSPPPNTGVLAKVVEDQRMKQVIIAQGIYDGRLLDLGVEIALANTTWNGKQGFSQPPTNAIVGFDGKTVGHFTKDRGLTYAAVDDAGHMIPANNPVAGRTLLQVLIGKRELDGSTPPTTATATKGTK